METDRCDAAALRTIGISSELARSHSSFQISSDRVSGLRKNTFIGIGWRAQETFNHSSGHIQLQVSLAQLEQLLHDAPARRRVVQELLELRQRYLKLDMPTGMIEGFLSPPPNPDKCIFAKTTHTVTADLKTRVAPCQFGGNPDCSQCGCIASVGLHQIGRHKLGGAIPVAWLYDASYRIGRTVASIRMAS